MAAPTPAPTAVTLRPRREGANIRTWIGFKQLMYLVEEAVLARFRERDFGPARLFHEYGLGLSIVDCSVQLPAPVDLDDEVVAEVAGGWRDFTVRLVTHHPDARTVLRGRVSVALLVEPDAPRHGPPPPELAPLVCAGTGVVYPAAPGAPSGAVDDDDHRAFHWSWRVPYHHCQFSHRLQFSGYLRAMEDVVDRFLADRGLSIGTVLRTRGWIPVVSRVALRQLDEVAMEETVHTVFAVTDVLANRGFDARMDCYVRGAAGARHVATGRILHGYAIARGASAGGLAELDGPTVAALLGERITA